MLSHEETEEGIVLSNRLLDLLTIGIMLVFVGITVLVVTSFVLGDSGSVGGIILIGPIPIVFGAGPNAILLIAISIIMIVVSIVLFLIMNRRRKYNG